MRNVSSKREGSYLSIPKVNHPIVDTLCRLYRNMNAHIDALLLLCMNIFHTSAYYGIHKLNIARFQCSRLCGYLLFPIGAHRAHPINRHRRIHSNRSPSIDIYNSARITKSIGKRSPYSHTKTVKTKKTG